MSNNNTTISKLTKVRSPTPISEGDFKLQMEKYSSYAKMEFPKDFSWIEKNFLGVLDAPTLVGIEIEVEGGGLKPTTSVPKFWHGKLDGSLRHGVEFFSSPLTPFQAFKATSIFYTVLKRNASKKIEFSWRTSIHDHLNALDLSVDGLKKLLLLSFLFEKVLFRFTGGERDQCVFCTPVTESLMRSLFSAFILDEISFRDLVCGWPKYSAVNLRRMLNLDGFNALGTIEFRHLGGTKNLPVVLMWHNILLSLYKAAVSLSSEELIHKIVDLDSNEKCWSLTKLIFPSEPFKYFHSEIPGLIFKALPQVKGLFMPDILKAIEPIKSNSSILSYAKAKIGKEKPQIKRKI